MVEELIPINKSRKIKDFFDFAKQQNNLIDNCKKSI